MPTTALSGLRVLDLTTVVMGPYATVVLADLGADVIKIETTTGDRHRFAGASRHAGMSAPAMNLHRNKRSLAVDLSTPDGREIFDGLVSTADLVVTNLRPRSRRKLGLDHGRLAAINPRIVLVTAQGWASDSADGDRPAYDDIIQAASGTAQLSAPVLGGPRYAPYAVADKVVGLHICIAALAAIVHQRRTGRGQHVDVPMVDSMISFNLVEHFGGHTFSPPEAPFGWARILEAERQPQRTADGWVCIMPYSDANWRDLFAFAGMTQFANDPAFTDINHRNANMGKLMLALRAETPKRTTAEWLRLCAEHGIPASSVLDLADVQADDYVRNRDVLSRRDHPTEGAYWATRTPFEMSDTPVAFTRHAPRIGEHTAELLAEAGFTPARVAELAEAGVVRLAGPNPVDPVGQES
ncbi:MAG TPA: CoA transferase [Amycolatopsis sp.]|nr:CoA transferase [Amycolatopsis sp.]